MVTSKQYSDVYTHKILAPAIALYMRNGSKGNATNRKLHSLITIFIKLIIMDLVYLLRNEWLNDPSANFHQFNKTAQVVSETGCVALL